MLSEKAPRSHDEPEASSKGALSLSEKRLMSTLAADESRRHEWKFLFTLFNTPEATDDVMHASRFYSALKRQYNQHFGETYAGLREALESDDELEEFDVRAFHSPHPRSRPAVDAQAQPCGSHTITFDPCG